jgi:hypothetical protein
MLKISAFYLDKQKSLYLKNIWSVPFSRKVLFSTNRWPLDVLTFLNPWLWKNRQNKMVWFSTNFKYLFIYVLIFAHCASWLHLRRKNLTKDIHVASSSMLFLVFLQLRTRTTDAKWSLFFIEIPNFWAWTYNLGR